MLDALGFFLLVEVIGLAAVPLAALAFGRLPGAGLGFAKPLGLLLVTWVVWMAASVTRIPYGITTVLVAVALLAGATGEARVLAGGTDLLVQMRADVVDPELIVDIKRIPETRRVTEEGGGWRIGAAVTGAELKEHPRLKQAWPGVVEAANLIGSTQVQGRATLGGNLCYDKIRDGAVLHVSPSSKVLRIFFSLPDEAYQQAS